MKTEFSEILLPGHRVPLNPSSSNNSSVKWFAFLAAIFAITITGMVAFYEIRFANNDARVSMMQNDLDTLSRRLGEVNKEFHDYIEEAYLADFAADEDDDEDVEVVMEGDLMSSLEEENSSSDEEDDEDDEDADGTTYGEVKLAEGGPKERSKRQIPTPAALRLDPTVPRTADGVPILENSYLDKIGAPTSGYIHWSNVLTTPTQDSEGLRLYESLVATGGRGEPRSPDYYPQTTANPSGILPHHRTSAAWVERPQRGGLQLKSGDGDDDDEVYPRTGSRSSVSSSNSNTYRHSSSSVTGSTDPDPNRGVTASSYFRSTGGNSGTSSSYLRGGQSGGNVVINRASRVPATGDAVYPQNSRARSIQYPPLRRIGQGDGEVVARVLQADNESEADPSNPASRVIADANLGDTAGAHAESRRTSRKGAQHHRRTTAGHRRHGGPAKLQRRAHEDPESDSDEINIVRAEAWTEGPKAVAAHYVADVSNYTTSHRHYEGNGRLRNANGIFSDWTPSEWMAGNEASKLAFSLSPNGILTIKQTGLYYVYAQIHYIDEHDINSFTVSINNNPFLQCTTMTETYNSGSKSNTCFTAGVTLLKENDRLFVRDVEVNRFAIFKAEKSFFGLMKLNGDSGLPKL